MRVLKIHFERPIWYHVVGKGLFDWLSTVKLDDFPRSSATSKDLSCMLKQLLFVYHYKRVCSDSSGAFKVQCKGRRSPRRTTHMIYLPGDPKKVTRRNLLLKNK